MAHGVCWGMLRLLVPVGFALAAWVSGAGLAAQDGWIHTFDQERLDHPPAGFAFASMRQVSAGRWTVQKPTGQAVLVHQAEPSASGYALAIADAQTSPDISVSARLRFAGLVKTGGLVWRYQDDRNFYALVLDLAARDLAMYRVAAGNRIRLDVEDDLELDPQGWHTLKVTHERSEIRVSLGGVRVFDEQDRRADRDKTSTGRVGVLAAGHADVWFDDLHFEPRRSRP